MEPVEDNPKPPSVGPFDLQRALGRGGMGEVWQAAHRQSGTTVAVKVLRGKRAQDESFREGFRAEVRSTALLAHPNIISIFDYGVLEAKDTEAGSRFVEGSPWLAMELAAGSLKGWRPRDYATMRQVLARVLEALAHSHARGMIHRDLKPENVLLRRPAVTPENVLLADFGIAHPMWARVDERSKGASAGSPYYMAPEQWLGMWRSIGPWTDLYALGCMAFELATGAPPFQGRSVVELGSAHLNADRPTVHPAFDCPAELIEWIGRLLSVAPQGRFEMAADALWALPPDAPSASAARHEEDPADVAYLTTLDAAGGASAVTPDGEEDDDAMCWSRADVPPFGSQTVVPATPTNAPAGTGLSLVDLRGIPFVGREQERGLLWDELRRASAGGVRLCVVRGDAGLGKSALATWLLQRAHETGSGATLVAEHGPTPGPEQGLRSMLARHFSCDRLPRAAAIEHLRRFLPEMDAGELPRLAEILRGDAGDGPSLFVLGDAERHRLFALALEQLCRRRPVVMLLDDVHWGDDSIAFARRLASFEDLDLRVLVVMTARSADIGAQSRAGRDLQALLDESLPLTLDIEPMQPAAQRDLLHAILRLDDAASERVIRRSEGNPLFALQIVSHWSRQNLWEPGDDGFRLGADAETLPSRIEGIWRDKLLAVEQAVGGTAGTRVLRLAAVLGRNVLRDELAAACERLDLAVPAGLVDALAARELAELRPNGWRFKHGLLLDFLRSEADAAGEAAELNLACADALAALPDARSLEVRERRGFHLLAADRLDEGFSLLLGCAAARLDGAEYGRATELIGRLEIAEADLGPADERRGQRAVLTLRLEGDLGHYETLIGDADVLIETARSHGWTAVESDALGYRALHGVCAGHLDGAVTLAEAAVEIARGISPENHAKQLGHLAQVYETLGRFEEATQTATAAIALHRQTGQRLRQAQCAYELAVVALRSQDDAVEAAARGAADLAAAVGNRLLEGMCWNVVGDALRLGSRPEEALEAYARAVDLWRAAGSPVDEIELNRAATLVDLGRYRSATRIYEAVIKAFEARNSVLGLAFAYSGALAAVAGLSDWTRFDEVVRAAEAVLDEVEGFTDLDLHRYFALAADLAESESRRARALRLAERTCP